MTGVWKGFARQTRTRSLRIQALLGVHGGRSELPEKLYVLELELELKSSGKNSTTWMCGGWGCGGGWNGERRGLDWNCLELEYS